MPPQRISTRTSPNRIYSRPTTHTNPNIHRLCDMLTDPVRRPYLEDILDQPEYARLQQTISSFDNMHQEITALHEIQADSHALLDQINIMRRNALAQLRTSTQADSIAILDQTDVMRQTALAQLRTGIQAETRITVLSQNALSGALCRGAWNAFREFFEELDTDEDSDGSMPLLIPNADIQSPGSSENPILIDDNDEPSSSPTATITQVSPTSSSSSSDEASGSFINIHNFVLPRRANVLRIRRAVPGTQCSICESPSHEDVSCPVNTD